MPYPGQAYEVVLPWGPTLRGVRWDRGYAHAVFLHEPAADKDLDAWGGLPLLLATALNVSAMVIDLPGHGLSDDPWQPVRLPEIVSTLADTCNPEYPLLIVAAGESAFAALEVAVDHPVAAVVALSPTPADPELTLSRSPATAKLVFAGAQDGDRLAVSRTLASSLGGWAVVTSISTDTRGTGMLATEWESRLSEHIVGFARDVLFRRRTPIPLRR